MNDVSLREHLEARLQAERLLTAEQFTAISHDTKKTALGLETRMVYERQVMEEKFAAILKDIEKTALALNHRLEGMNQFRAQLLEERGQYVRKESFEWIVKQVYMAMGAVSLLVLLVPVVLWALNRP